VRLRPLSLVDEGDQVLVGDPQVGTFVAVPAIGGVVLRALQRGATIGEAARAAEELAGEPVDVPAFVATLRELGFVDDRPDGAGQAERLPYRVSAIQGRHWLYGLRPELARPLFGRVAWVCYAAAAVFNVGALAVAHDRLWPRPAEDAFVFADIGLSGLFFVPFVTLLAALHEAWHWLAARALGIPARFGVDRRMVFLVFETDLSRLWTLPRRQRYSPILAGLALDSVVLCAVLTARLAITGGHWSAPELVASALALCAFVLVFRIGWQCMIFLRTDLYAVLLVATGCRNLWRVKSLLLRRAFGRLTPAHADELAAADPTDVRVGRWFRWVWLAGFLGVTGWSLLFLAPVIATALAWAADGLVLGPVHWQFWYRAAATAVMLGPWLMVAFLAARSLLQRLAARTASARRAGDRAPGLFQLSGPDRR
jgi:hypothetical protein